MVQNSCFALLYFKVGQPNIFQTPNQTQTSLCLCLVWVSCRRSGVSNQTSQTKHVWFGFSTKHLTKHVRLCLVFSKNYKNHQFKKSIFGLIILLSKYSFRSRGQMAKRPPSVQKPNMSPGKILTKQTKPNMFGLAKCFPNTNIDVKTKHKHKPNHVWFGFSNKHFPNMFGLTTLNNCIHSVEKRITSRKFVDESLRDETNSVNLQ